MSAPGNDLVVIGRLGRPHGLAGEVRVQPTGPTLGTLGPGAAVQAIGADGGTRALVIESARRADQMYLVRFRDVADRDAAARLTGSQLAVDEFVLPSLDEPDEFYVRDLVGCVVYLGAAPLGQVADIHPGSANDALVVRRPDAGEVLVPFTHDAIVRIDVPGRSVHVRADLLGEGDG